MCNKRLLSFTKYKVAVSSYFHHCPISTN